MSEAPLEPEEVEKIRQFIRELAKELSRIFKGPDSDLDQLFPQFALFEQNKELQGDPELDEKDG